MNPIEAMALIDAIMNQLNALGGYGNVAAQKHLKDARASMVKTRAVAEMQDRYSKNKAAA